MKTVKQFIEEYSTLNCKLLSAEYLDSEGNLKTTNGFKDNMSEVISNYDKFIKGRTTMVENLIIGILSDIRLAVWDRDTPNPTCPEYIEHHEACLELISIIDEKMRMFENKSDEEVAHMLLNR